MKSKTIYTNNSTYPNVSLKIPNKCPHCSYFNDPHKRGSYMTDFNNKHILLAVWCCSNEDCSKNYLTTHLITSEQQIEFLNIYPKNKLEKFDDLIVECSPEFVELYNHAYQEQLNGNIRIAAVSYRMALEFLLKDYLIKYHKDYQLDINQIPTMKIINCLNYLEKQQQVAGDVVRILGNDYIHYHNKNENIDFNHLKIYLDIFVHSILVQLRLKNPPVTRP